MKRRYRRATQIAADQKPANVPYSDSTSKTRSSVKVRQDRHYGIAAATFESLNTEGVSFAVLVENAFADAL